jgi:hypothetical protein
MFLEDILQHIIRGPILYDVSRDSAVSIATGYWLDDRVVGVPSPGGIKNFHFSVSFRLALGSTQPSIQWIPAALSPGVKPSGREAGHLPPTSAEAQKTLPFTLKDNSTPNHF